MLCKGSTGSSPHCQSSSMGISLTENHDPLLCQSTDFHCDKMLGMICHQDQVQVSQHPSSAAEAQYLYYVILTVREQLDLLP